MNDNLCAEKEDNVIFQTTVPLLSAKDEQSNIVRKTITMSMLEEEYPSELWARVYTDGSATNATTKGGAGIYIEYPNGEQQSMAIPARLYTASTTRPKKKHSSMQQITSQKTQKICK